MLIGVDFGGTQVKAGIVEQGEVVRSTATPTRAGSSAAEVLDTIASTRAMAGTRQKYCRSRSARGVVKKPA